jgi:hypothetical protein
MWLFTRYGFYSIACARQPNGLLDPCTVMIRARRSSHLRNLQRRFPTLANAEIVSLPNRDYRYRLIVPKEAWVRVIAELAQEQEWSNFKAETARYQSAEPEYVGALHDVWSVMYHLQETAG